jgi:hypothetical protein
MFEAHKMCLEVAATKFGIAAASCTVDIMSRKISAKKK